MLTLSNLFMQVVNFGSDSVNLVISINGLDPNIVRISGATQTLLTSVNVMDENSFSQPRKVA